jgi:MFS family permease
MATTTVAPAGKGVGYLRWGVCALLFLATTINYVDRQVIALLKPTLQHELGWSEVDYADIVFAFQLAYAIGLLVAGRVIDRIGTKLGFSLALLVWSAAAVAHAWALGIGRFAAPVLGLAGLAYSGSVAGFIAVRFLLGLGEGGNFPAAIKTVAEWFPKKERALATGRDWPGLAPAVVAALCAGGAASAPLSRGARLHPERSAGSDGPRAVAEADSAPPDVGRRRRQGIDGPDLVAVPLLDP